MTKEKMLELANQTYNYYLDECKKNGNSEGSVMAFYYFAQMELIKKCFKEYFNFDYSFMRYINGKEYED